VGILKQGQIVALDTTENLLAGRSSQSLEDVFVAIMQDSGAGK